MHGAEVAARRWSRPANALLAAGSAGLVLALFEGLLAYDDRRPDAARFTTAVRLDGTDYRFLETRAAIDDAARAVLIVGDSFTAGAACADGRTFPHAFTRAAARSGAGIHAVNMGVAGTGPISYALRARDYLAEKGTAAGLILAFCANDVDIDCDACRTLGQWSHLGGLTSDDRQSLRKACEPCLADGQRVAGEVGAGRRLHWWLAGRLRTYRLAREAAARLGLPGAGWGRAAYPALWRDADGAHFKHLRAAIELARQEAGARGLPMMVVLYPDPARMSPGDEQVALYERAGTLLGGATAVPVFSGYQAFLGHPRARETMTFSLTDAHPSCDAHALFGEWVFEKWTRVRSDVRG